MPVADVEQGLNGAAPFQTYREQGVLLPGWLCLPACGGCSLAVHTHLYTLIKLKALLVQWKGVFFSSLFSSK